MIIDVHDDIVRWSYSNDKGYRPRKGRYIAEKPDKDLLDMIKEQEHGDNKAD